MNYLIYFTSYSIVMETQSKKYHKREEKREVSLGTFLMFQVNNVHWRTNGWNYKWKKMWKRHDSFFIVHPLNRKCAINKYKPIYKYIVVLRGTWYSFAGRGQRMLSSPAFSLCSRRPAPPLPPWPLPPSILLIFSSIRVNVLSVRASCRAGKLYYVNLEAL